MTYEECEKLVIAFEQAAILKQRTSGEEHNEAVMLVDNIGAFIASVMTQAWKRSVD